MSRLRRLEKVALWVAVVGGGMGFLTSAGCVSLPVLPAASLAVLHPLLLGLGIAGGIAVVIRGREIDAERWRIVEDPMLTKGEREYAHKHAERRRRHSGTVLLAAPILLGYWLAYQVAGEGRALLAQLLPVTALLGAVAGLLLGRHRSREPGPR